MQQVLLEIMEQLRKEMFDLMLMVAPIALGILAVFVVHKKFLFFFYDITGVGNVMKRGYENRIKSLYAERDSAPSYMKSYYNKDIYRLQREYRKSSFYGYSYYNKKNR